MLVGTLLPERATVGSCRASTPDSIEPTNVRIRALAAAHNVPLVDLHAAFVGQLDTLLGQDGLHPSDAGYRRIAELFMQAIQARFEPPPP